MIFFAAIQWHPRLAPLWCAGLLLALAAWGWLLWQRLKRRAPLAARWIALPKWLALLLLALFNPVSALQKSQPTKAGEAAIELKPSEPLPGEKTVPLSPIDPSLFEIHNPTKLCWDDDQPLLDFGEDGSEDDIWRLKDASEGVLIFGARSSGKTSGSGYRAKPLWTVF